MTTLAEFTAAATDPELRARLVAAAQEAGIPNAEYWVDANRGSLTRASVGDPGNAAATVASVYAYAWNVYRETLPQKPGANPGAVTDDHIRHAVDTVFNPPAVEVPSGPPVDPPAGA